MLCSRPAHAASTAARCLRHSVQRHDVWHFQRTRSQLLRHGADRLHVHRLLPRRIAAAAAAAAAAISTSPGIATSPGTTTAATYIDATDASSASRSNCADTSNAGGKV